MKSEFGILLFIFLVSCSSSVGISDSIRFDYEDFSTPIELKAEILTIDTLWKPNRIWCKDSLLIMTDIYNDYLVQIYHKDKGNKIAENIPYGLGPDERINCWSLQFNSDLIWAFDMQMAKMTAYKKADFLTQYHIPPIKTVHFNKASPVGIVSLSNGQFILSDLADRKNLLTIYTQEGIKDSIRHISYPQIVNSPLPDNLSKRFFENRIYFNEANDKIVVFYVYTDLIDIYDSDLNLLTRIQGPDHFVPELGIQGENNHVHVIAHKTKFAYLSACLTSQEIWALYYGISPEPGKELQNRIFVFDYTGKPLRSYYLEHPVSTFCIDEESKIIYALSENPETCVIKFKI